MHRDEVQAGLLVLDGGSRRFDVVALAADGRTRLDVGGDACPDLRGMALGQTIRKDISEMVFRAVFLGALALLGAYQLGRALLG